MRMHSRRSEAAAIALAVLVSIPTLVDGQSGVVERRIHALLAQMTLEEKLGQLLQLDGHADGRYREDHLELARKGLLGSYEHAVDVKERQNVVTADLTIRPGSGREDVTHRNAVNCCHT